MITVDSSENIGYQMYECQRPGCGLRFPVPSGSPAIFCPICRAQTLAKTPEYKNEIIAQNISKQAQITMELLLDNIRSSQNVGAIFRTANGCGISAIHLCGITPTPHSKGFDKTSLGSERDITWSYSPNALITAKDLQKSGYEIWALEGSQIAQTIFAVHPEPSSRKLILAIGNERSGIDPEIINLANRVVYIPMIGTKNSLNVAVACGIAIYTILNQFTSYAR